jgi:hypothetical protein
MNIENDFKLVSKIIRIIIKNQILLNEELSYFSQIIDADLKIYFTAINDGFKIKIDECLQKYLKIKSLDKSIWWSAEAIDRFEEIFEETGKFPTKSKPYFKRDHVVPKTMHSKELLKLVNQFNIHDEELFCSKLVEYFHLNFKICVITEQQHNNLGSVANLVNCNLSQDMPGEWTWQDGAWIRYKAVNIKWHLTTYKSLIRKYENKVTHFMCS